MPSRSAKQLLQCYPLRASVPKLEAQHVLNIGKSKLYELLGRGLLDAVKNGPHTEITVESIKQLQANMPRATFKPPPPPRMESLSKLHAKQRQLAAQRRAKPTPKAKTKSFATLRKIILDLATETRTPYADDPRMRVKAARISDVRNEHYRQHVNRDGDTDPKKLQGAKQRSFHPT